MRVLRGLWAPWPVVGAAAAVLLLTAGLACGVWIWPRAWLFLAAFGGLSMVCSAVMALARPASFAVRQQGIVADRQKKQPLIDALGLVAYTACLLAWLAFIPIEVFRLRLWPPPSAGISGAGGAAAILGLILAYAAIGQNPFAAPTIHDQSADGQRVIDTGLYAVVRHPFYAGMLLVYGGAALWLGSYAALIAASGFLVMTLARIVIEEAWLRDHLPDYAGYARRVRGRLIPWVL